jgi:hypothetical protein
MEAEIEAWVPSATPLLCGTFMEPCGHCESFIVPSPVPWPEWLTWYGQPGTESREPTPPPSPVLPPSQGYLNISELLLCRETFAEVIADEA